MEDKNIVLDIIIEFIKGCRNKKKDDSGKDYAVIENGKSGADYMAINSPDYLLGQILRQYHIPPSHYFISAAAVEKWKEISSEPIFKYWYRSPVTKDTDGETEILRFVGNTNNRESKKIHKGDTFIFRDVFHDEHIVPISMVLEKLCGLKNPDYENVKETLDKIYICRMLKTEDRDNITSKSKRSLDLDYKKNIEDYYENIDVIEVKSFDQVEFK